MWQLHYNNMYNTSPFCYKWTYNQVTWKMFENWLYKYLGKANSIS